MSVQNARRGNKVKIGELKLEIQKIQDNKKEITINEFRKKFCNHCYWQEWGKCDIDRVKLEYCVSSEIGFFRSKYRLI